jgi:hypothetical protein
MLAARITQKQKAGIAWLLLRSDSSRKAYLPERASAVHHAVVVEDCNLPRLQDVLEAVLLGVY